LLRANAESVGLVKVQGKDAKQQFSNSLGQLAKIKENRNSFSLSIFNHLTLRDIPVELTEIDGSKHWQEIDFHMDVKLAQQLIADEMSKF